MDKNNLNQWYTARIISMINQSPISLSMLYLWCKWSSFILFHNLRNSRISPKNEREIKFVSVSLSLLSLFCKAENSEYEFEWRHAGGWHPTCSISRRDKNTVVRNNGTGIIVIDIADCWRNHDELTSQHGFARSLYNLQARTFIVAGFHNRGD